MATACSGPISRTVAERYIPSQFIFIFDQCTATYEKLDIAEFVSGFLEMIKVSEVGVQKALSDYLHLLMEKATHYQWPAVRHFHAAISNAIEQRRLLWEDFEVTQSKSNTHFLHADLRANINNSNSRYASQLACGQSRSREKKASYCEAWNNFYNCSCVITEPSYKDRHLCRVCDKDHPKLHCPLRRFPIKASPGQLTRPSHNEYCEDCELPFFF